MKLCVVALLLLLPALVAHADPLTDRLSDSAAALKAGAYVKALKISNGVIRDMVEKLGPGQNEAMWFSVALVHKALALAGRGEKDEAIWFWEMALNIYPAVARSDMSMFGAPADFLKSYSMESSTGLLRVGAKSKDAVVRAPVVIRKVDPHYTNGARFFDVRGIAVLECVVDKNGDVKNIRLLKALPAPTLSYEAMQAIRRWKFSPATLEGQPVDVIFNLTINYKLE